LEDLNFAQGPKAIDENECLIGVIPTEMGNLINLDTLSLVGGARFGSEIPVELNRMTALETISLIGGSFKRSCWNVSYVIGSHWPLRSCSLPANLQLNDCPNCQNPFTCDNDPIQCPRNTNAPTDHPTSAPTNFTNFPTPPPKPAPPCEASFFRTEECTFEFKSFVAIGPIILVVLVIVIVLSVFFIRRYQYRKANSVQYSRLDSVTSDENTGSVRDF
jgi:hypothetical protein